MQVYKIFSVETPFLEHLFCYFLLHINVVLLFGENFLCLLYSFSKSENTQPTIPTLHE